MSAKLAGYNLYISRGMVDQDDTRYNQLKMHYDYAEGVLDDLICDRLTIDAPVQAPTTFPTVE